MRIRPTHARAWSLVDGIAFCAVGSILLLILGQTAGEIRSDDHKARCLDVLRGIGNATAQYSANDPKGWALPAHWRTFLQDRAAPTFIGAYEWGGKAGIGDQGYAKGIGAATSVLSSRYGTAADFGPAARPLNTYLAPTRFVDHSRQELNAEGALADTKLDFPEVRCPSDDGPPGGAHRPDWLKSADRSSFDHFGTSYSANILWGAPVPVSASHTSTKVQIRSNSPYLRPVERVPAPSSTIAYEENIGRFAWACRREWCPEYQLGLDPGPTKAIRGWHGKDCSFNFAFVDGHADTIRMFFDGTEDDEGYALHYRGENAFESEEMNACYRCDSVRGAGWRKDTLPSPQIETGISWNGHGRPAYEDSVGQ